MINIPELIKRHQLRSLRDRISETDDAFDLAHGLWIPPDNHILPAPNNRARTQAWLRAKRQVASLGPRILEAKRNAVLGDVTWGGNSDELDERLATLDVRALAERLLTPYIITGVTAAYAHDTQAGDTRISRLGGFLEPITHDDDMDQIVGLYQAWQVIKDRQRDLTTTNFNDNLQPSRYVGRWVVRIYDWSESEEGLCRLVGWENLRDPTELAHTPVIQIEDHPRPRYRVRGMSQDGLTLGEVLVNTPSLKALYGTEARLYLAEELAAHPMLVTRGDVDLEAVGPNEVAAADPDGDVRWLEPGNLEELRQQRALRMERLREDFSLPGGFLGNDSPSGEAFREANIRFRQVVSAYARDISGLLTELVEDYAALVSVEPAEVSISPSKEYDEAERIQTLVLLHERGLLPLQVIANELQPFFPTWSDADLNAWVDEQTARITPGDFRGLLARTDDEDEADADEPG